MAIGIPLFLFFTHFAFGLLFALAFVSSKGVKASYFRFNSMMSLVAIILATMILNLEYSRFFKTWMVDLYKYWILAIIFVLIYFLLLRAEKTYLSKACLLISILGGLLIIAAEAVIIKRGLQLTGSLFVPAYYLNYLASAFLLGSVTTAMILGHWYLIDPKLSISHLRRHAQLYIAALGLRAGFIALTLVFYLNQDSDQLFNLINLFDPRSNGIFFWLRVAIGLIGPMVLAFLVWKTVQIRSTQSATGLLYVAVILVLFGELMSKYLSVVAFIPV